MPRTFFPPPARNRRSCAPLPPAEGSALTLPWRMPRLPKACVVPVFLPFGGCHARCVFCAQHEQTGQTPCPPGAPGGVRADVSAVLAAARRELESRAARGLPPAETAFYGGTFTALPPAEMAACLHFARGARNGGLVTSFRVSTRPDRVDAAVLERLRGEGCGIVELGVQSFAEHALAASRRGYDRSAALEACARVRAAGLRLGVQLLPGMPGHSPADFAADVRLALDAGAEMLRFYPCLVLEGTELARIWRGGGYAPWPLDVTLGALAHAWLAALEAGVPVIRMGLAPEESLARSLLAGPVDPALGCRVMGRGLLLAVRRALRRAQEDRSSFAVQLPVAAQGYVWGARRELRPVWEDMGLERIFWSREPVVRILLSGI